MSHCRNLDCAASFSALLLGLGKCQVSDSGLPFEPVTREKCPLENDLNLISDHLFWKH